MNMPDLTGKSNEEIIAIVRAYLPTLSPAEIAENERLRKERYEKEQAQYKEWYEAGERWLVNSFDETKEYRLYKRACPVCGTVFYTTNKYRVYDDYYQCSRYVHRKNAKNKRAADRKSVCLECGAEFVPQRKGAKYCCAGCKQKAYRKRHTLNEVLGGQNDHMEQP